MTETVNNMYKLVFLANEQKTNHLVELGAKFYVPVIDYDLAMFEAQQRGFIKINEKKTTFDVIDLPVAWQFGDDVSSLIEKILNLFAFHALSESDIEESILTGTMQGYPPHDQLIAVKYLLNTEKLASYELTNTTKLDKKSKPIHDTYTFYCLSENKDKQWGKKQFADEKRVK